MARAIARELDAKGYTAQLVVEQALGAGPAAGSALAIAWEELASARPPRFASGDRVLVCLDALPGSTLWLRRFPDPEQRREVLVVANRGGAFLRNPLPGELDALEHYARLTPSDRAGPQARPGWWSSRRARSCRSPRTPWRGSRARATLAQQLDADLAPQLIEALLRAGRERGAAGQDVLRADHRAPPAGAAAAARGARGAQAAAARARLRGARAPRRRAAARAQRCAAARCLARAPRHRGALRERSRRGGAARPNVCAPIRTPACARRR